MRHQWATTWIIVRNLMMLDRVAITLVCVSSQLQLGLPLMYESNGRAERAPYPRNPVRRSIEYAMLACMSNGRRSQTGPEHHRFLSCKIGVLVVGGHLKLPRTTSTHTLRTCEEAVLPSYLVGTEVGGTSYDCLIYRWTLMFCVARTRFPVLQHTRNG